MRLGYAQFPGQTGILDACPGACASAAIMTRYDNVLGFSLQKGRPTFNKF